MRKETRSYKTLEKLYGERGVPQIGQLYKIDQGFKRIQRLKGSREVAILSMTLTDVYVRFTESGRQSNMSHTSFLECHKRALKLAMN